MNKSKISFHVWFNIKRKRKEKGKKKDSLVDRYKGKKIFIIHQFNRRLRESGRENLENLFA